MDNRNNMNNKIAQELESETKKWLKKLKEDMEKRKHNPSTGAPARTVLKNIHSYIEDCNHFLEKGDLVRAFEAVIYAWGLWDGMVKYGLGEK
jgi:hypothetical protein